MWVARPPQFHHRFVRIKRFIWSIRVDNAFGIRQSKRQAYYFEVGFATSSAFFAFRCVWWFCPKQYEKLVGSWKKQKIYRCIWVWSEFVRELDTPVPLHWMLQEGWSYYFSLNVEFCPAKRSYPIQWNKKPQYLYHIPFHYLVHRSNNVLHGRFAWSFPVKLQLRKKQMRVSFSKWNLTLEWVKDGTMLTCSLKCQRIIRVYQPTHALVDVSKLTFAWTLTANLSQI